MKTMKECLFGGALLSAGIAANAAAQNFTLPGNLPGYANTYVAAYIDTAFGLAGYSSLDGGIPDFVVTNAFSGSVNASIFSDSIEAYAFAGTDNYAFAQAYAYISVDQDATLELAWDFTGEGADGPLGEIEIIDWSSGGLLVFSTTAFTAGTDSVDLFAGTNYGINFVATADQNNTAFANGDLVPIPAPASAALMGLAGLAASRRRR